MKVGFIGLGVMGQPMALNLERAGIDLIVYNRTKSKTRIFEKTSAEIAAGAHQVFAESDVVLLMLSDEKAIDKVLCRSGDEIKVDLKGRILVNMATVSPNYSRRLSEGVAANGGTYMEAPVSGSRKPAEKGTLVILVAGSERATGMLTPLWNALGKATLPCGEVPNASAMKLANNLLLISMLEALAEAYHFADRAGLDKSKFFDIVLGGPLANDVFKLKIPQLLSQDFAAQAPIKHVTKDLRLIHNMASEIKARVPTATSNLAVFEEAVSRGLGDHDATAVLRILEAGTRK